LRTWVVDNEAFGNTIKKLKCPTMGSPARSQLSDRDDLSVLVAAVGKGHHKDPGGEDFPGVDVR